MRYAIFILLFSTIIAAAVGCKNNVFLHLLDSSETRQANEEYDDILFVQDPAFRVRGRLRSLQDLKHENVVIQKYDYSCGAATLATMMQFYFRDDVAEDEILKETLKQMTPK
ncbi:MAG: hypothetical protein IH991_22255, partial [Planctomycetes bacterium]|nr:hypothetical protein [Planctomycetota bacterium]